MPLHVNEMRAMGFRLFALARGQGMLPTVHRSVQMVRRYIRDGSLFRENSAGKLGL